MDAETGIADWYRTRPGVRAATLLARAVKPYLSTAHNARLLGLGFVAPLLRGVRAAPQGHQALIMPAALEERAAWPPGVPGRLAVADPVRLPFVEALFDTALVAHALELSHEPRAVLRELWRVLGPAGHLILIVPNRSGPWARFEQLPFGQGRPYGRRQLDRLLGEAMFEIVRHRTLLAAPPLPGTAWLERPLSRLAPRLGGVHLVAARKTDGLARMAAERATARLRPVLEG